MGHIKAIHEDSAQLTQLHALMMDIPLISGHDPPRWRHCIDVMLTKNMQITYYIIYILLPYWKKI